MTDVITVFDDELGDWHWHRVGPGTDTSDDIAYEDRSDVLDAVYRANPDNEYDLHIEKPVN